MLGGMVSMETDFKTRAKERKIENPRTDKELIENAERARSGI